MVLYLLIIQECVKLVLLIVRMDWKVHSKRYMIYHKIVGFSNCTHTSERDCAVQISDRKWTDREIIFRKLLKNGKRERAL